MQNQSIEDMVISIKVMKINNRKMSQAAFKQLPEKSVFDSELNLVGEIWGHVNYFWGKQKTNGYHIIWKIEGKLYRYIAQFSSNNFHDALRIRIDRRNDFHGYDDSDLKNMPLELSSIIEKVADGELSKEEGEEKYNKYDDHLRTIRSIPQLFIAV